MVLDSNANVVSARAEAISLYPLEEEKQEPRDLWTWLFQNPEQLDPLQYFKATTVHTVALKQGHGKKQNRQKVVPTGNG